MGVNSKIEWCHHTMNPWRGCTKISEGCTNCYAETLSHRNPAVLGEWGNDGTRVIASESAWNQPVKWNRWAGDGVCWKCAGRGFLSGPKVNGVKKRIECEFCAGTGGVKPYRARVFCASLADVFEDRPELLTPRARLFDLIYATPRVDWLLLTKRPENFAHMLPWSYYVGGIGAPDTSHPALPWKNVWLGVSTETQKHLDERASILRTTPAAVRFLSAEPLLGDLDITKHVFSTDGFVSGVKHAGPIHRSDGGAGIDWIIAGGESGHGARPMNVEWVNHLRDQCEEANVPFFFKQWGEWVGGNCFAAEDGIYVEAQNGQTYQVQGNFKSMEWHDWDERLVESPASVRVGKHVAGRHLQGLIYNQFPEVK